MTADLINDETYDENDDMTADETYDENDDMTADETYDENDDMTADENDDETDDETDYLTYEEYEKRCEEIMARNASYLDEFREDLKKAGLTDKTIGKHCGNVDLYLNTYLLREEPLEMGEGTAGHRIDDFLGYFFIRKCMWSTPASIKSTASSIKKFYKSMLERGRIEAADYEEITSTIKEMTEEWMEVCSIYNDPSEENPFGFF